MKLFSYPFRAMGGPNELQLYANDTASADGIAKLAIVEVERIEAKYSRYRDDSVLSRINQSAGLTATTVDTETAALLDYAAACHAQSEGLFDISSGVLRRAWNFSEACVPSEEKIAALLKQIGWGKISWHRPVLSLPAGMEIDFGGIGKEYAADRVASVCMEHGAPYGFVNLGGDIRVFGPHPDGSSWSIGIAHPRRADRVLASLIIPRGAIATSGDYERYFEIDGHRYCHILNPKTGYPTSGLQAVTVIAPLCTVAGSLSTIAMLKGKEGINFLAAQEMPWMAVNAKGHISGPLAGKN
ncbi:MAG: FAD:protein FMN transferase [Burkholderiales bacterium]